MRERCEVLTGAVTVREEQWWPVLNDARLYSTDQERLESEDRFEPPRQQGGISARRSRRLMPAAPGRHTPQRVQPVPVPIRPDVLPDRPLSSASGIRPREHIPCPRKRIDKVAVLVQGSTERIFTNNVANMKTALERAGFTVFTFRPDTDRLDEVRDFIRILGRSLDECDKFVLYVAGHGDSGSLTYGDDAWRFAAGDSESIPRSLSDDVNAGHRVLILQSCKSGGVIPHMQAAFSRAGRDQNVEVEVLTASDALQDAYAENWWFINRWTHSIYSKALSDELMSANLDLDGNGFVDVDEFDTVLRASGGIAAAAHDAYGIGQGEPAPNGQVGQLVPVEAVRLDQPLVDPGTGQTRFPAGADIELSRITGGRRAAPDACDSLHLHGIGAGIIVDGTMGPFPDPNPSGCGYGRIMIVYRFVAQ